MSQDPAKSESENHQGSGNFFERHGITWKLFFIFLAFLAPPLIGGFTSGISSSQNIEGWYNLLEKEDWFPPNWLFAPMWTILYILMGVGSFLAWKDSETTKKRIIALSFYFVQLALNFAWTPVFFGAHQVLAGLYIIVVLDVLVLITIGVFYWAGAKWGALCLVPYMVWICIATGLNATIYRLNGANPEV